MAFIDDARTAYAAGDTELSDDWTVISGHISSNMSLYEDEAMAYINRGNASCVIGNVVKTAVEDFNKTAPGNQRIDKKRLKRLLHNESAVEEKQTD